MLINEILIQISLRKKINLYIIDPNKYKEIKKEESYILE